MDLFLFDIRDNLAIFLNLTKVVSNNFSHLYFKSALWLLHKEIFFEHQFMSCLFTSEVILYHS